MHALLDRLAPVAVRVRHGLDPLPPARLFGCAAFHHDHTPAKAGWARELAGHPVPAGEDAGVITVAFRAHRPFHPARLHEQLRGLPDELLRSRGRCWLATDPEVVFDWDQTGPILLLEASGRWLADSSEARADLDDDDARAVLDAHWDPCYGDRRTEVVLTGVHLDGDAVLAALTACLLTDAELALGEDGWRDLENPLA